VGLEEMDKPSKEVFEKDQIDNRLIITNYFIVKIKEMIF
jgi:hypothetical protein